MATKRKAAENAAIAVAEQASQRKPVKSVDWSKSDGKKEMVVKAQADWNRIEASQTLDDHAAVEDSSETVQMLPADVTKRTAMERTDEEEGDANATDDRSISQNIKAVSSHSGATRSSSRKCMKSASADVASQQAHHRDTSTLTPAFPRPLRCASRPRSKAKLVATKTPPDVSSDSAKPEEHELANKRPAPVRDKSVIESSKDGSSNPTAKSRNPKSSKKSPSHGSSKMDQKEPTSQEQPADSVAADESGISSDSSNDAQVDISGEFAIVVLHSGRPQVKQVYSAISFQGLPDSKIHSTIVRPFCFGHDHSIQETIEDTDERPDPEEEGAIILRPLKKSFLNVNRFTFFAVTDFQPSSQNKESVLRTGPQQKTHSTTGLPMVDSKSRDFVQDFDAAFCAGNQAAEHTKRQDETLSGESQNSDGGGADGDGADGDPEEAEGSSSVLKIGVDTSSRRADEEDDRNSF